MSAGTVFWTASGFGCNLTSTPGGGGVFGLAANASTVQMLVTGAIGPTNLYAPDLCGPRAHQ